MKRLLLIISIVIIAINSFSQDNCKIENEYENIFMIRKTKYGEREFLFKSANKIDSNSCFSDLINNNLQYVEYLLTHFSDNSNYDKLLTYNDSIQLQKEFIKSLQKDSLFNSVMNKFTEKVSDKSQFVPDTISFDELLNIAVKYFLIDKIKDEKYYGKLCTGINGLRQTEKERKPHIEAFCFSTIFNNYQGEQFSMHDEFVSGIKELHKINLGIDNDDRLLRAQGAMYMHMRNNDKLKELLLSEYEHKKEYLPFILKD